ncbi:hypothetical protein [Streptomyces sp. AcH 505]|uniref:hypothetical protein n=1 Tax=Streptomyces sp. AcH 505 TaxID=352211 RepID=UPI001F52111A
MPGTTVAGPSPISPASALAISGGVARSSSPTSTAAGCPMAAADVRRSAAPSIAQVAA